MTLDPLAPRIEISRAALAHNVRALRQRLGRGRLIAAVLKGNAYGHGRDLVASLVADRVDLLAAADPSDAIALAEIAPGRAMCLGPAHGEALTECLHRRVQVAVTGERQVAGLGPDARVHLLVDTGLHRLGTSPDHAPALAAAVRATGARIDAACCMVARADHGDWEAVAEEVRLLRALPLGVNRLHTGGSSVTLERPDLAGDIGRPGLALLGYHPRAHQRTLVDLEPTLRLVAPILELRTVAAGGAVGYQARPVERDTVVATLGIGTAHGLHPETDARVIVDVVGTHCPVLCPPSLEYCLIDVTDARGVDVGSEVVLLGGRPGTPTSAVDFANRLEVIIDHVLTPLAASLHRVSTA